MKKNSIQKSLVALTAALLLMSAVPGDEPITKNGKETIVNTTTIAEDVKGYIGTTPLKIYIVNNKNDQSEALPHPETPKYCLKETTPMLDE